MNEPRATPETSMEEILASIRRIISEDGSASAAAPPPPPSAMPPATWTPPAVGNQEAPQVTIESEPLQALPLVEPVPAPDAPPTSSPATSTEPDAPAAPAPGPPPASPSALDDQQAPKSEELVLTQMVAEDGSLVALGRPQIAPASPAAEAEKQPLEVLLLTNALPAGKPEAVVRPVQPAQRRAREGSPTLEDLVRESVEPKIQQWLNANLKDIVERLVQQEIDKISRQD